MAWWVGGSNGPRVESDWTTFLAFLGPAWEANCTRIYDTRGDLTGGQGPGQVLLLLGLLQ